MKQTFAVIFLALSAMLFASGAAEARSTYGAGWYAGGIGSSHKGGRYVNPQTGNHYRHRL